MLYFRQMKSLSTNSFLRLAHSYPGNLGFVEMMRFQDFASDEEKDQMDQLLDQDKFEEAWELLQQVTETHLEPF